MGLRDLIGKIDNWVTERYQEAQAKKRERRHEESMKQWKERQEELLKSKALNPNKEETLDEVVGLPQKCKPSKYDTYAPRMSAGYNTPRLASPRAGIRIPTQVFTKPTPLKKAKPESLDDIVGV